MFLSDAKQSGFISCCLATALIALAVSTMTVSSWEKQLVRVENQEGLSFRTYGSVENNWQDKWDPRLYRKTRKDEELVSVEYGFLSLHDDQITVNLSMPAELYSLYRQQFGYRQSELDDLLKKQKDSLGEAYNTALRTGTSNKELKKTYAAIKNNYREGVKELYRSRGFRFSSEDVLVADIPGIVKWNVDVLNRVATSLSETMSHLDYDPDDLLGITLPMMQKAIPYEALPVKDNGLITAGYSLPLEVLIEGRGDCDSKTGLLAALLLNWDKVKLIGVGVPKHYLLGMLQHPARGDAYIEYQGLNYVLMEPAGPALLPPGVISETTRKWLMARDVVKIEALTRN